jgi:HAD superfamily hydrolase (TIGR01509 family)
MKLIIFDLDGVLLDCKEIHRDAFISAWNNEVSMYAINISLHNDKLEGRNTKKKIEYLEQLFNIKVNASCIFNSKQKYTSEHLKIYEFPNKFRKILEELRFQGYKIACASNSIRETVTYVLTKLHIIDLMDSILSNEDVSSPKPSPDIYLKTMRILNTIPTDTYILEDSEIGLEAARSSGANVIKIIDSIDVTLEKIIYNVSKLKYMDTNWKLRVVIPMAGDGTRFKNAGYSTPKPLIEVGGKYMIKWVLDNLSSKNVELQSRIEYHLCVRSEWIDELKEIENVHIHPIPSLTDGPACTVLSIRDILEKDDGPILIANSDQFLEWDFDEFLEACSNPTYDGCISTFYQPNPTDIKWSYAKQDENGIVLDVAEKRYISPHASTGIYFWKSSREFVKYADTMITNNIRVNNEFYVCPVYKLAIDDGKKIRTHNCNKMWGLGIPTDLEIFKTEYLSNQNI